MDSALKIASWFKICFIILSLSTLSACQWFTDSDAWKKPLPPHLVRAIKNRGFQVGAHILARLYKEENRFEVWMEKNGRFQFFKSYGICSWSGELGPKLKEGDRQAPEGFYVVTPAQMNPRSKFYLSFNLGYPNFYDRSLGRTGSQLMVHGECSSRGCYALTNPNIEEVYLLARDAFKNGQRRFHVHAFPFRLNAFNYFRHRDNKWMDFWKNLAEGDKIFKATGLPPKMIVANKRYVFAPADVRVAQPKSRDIIVASKTPAQTTNQPEALTDEPPKPFQVPAIPPAGLWAIYSNRPLDMLIFDAVVDDGIAQTQPEILPQPVIRNSSSSLSNIGKGKVNPVLDNEKFDALKFKVTN